MHICFRIAAAAVAVLVLASCSPEPAVPGPAGTPTSGPAATAAVPQPPATSAAAPDPATRSQDPPSSAPAASVSGGARWGAFAGKQEACVAVAANVAVLLLAPLSFLTEVDEEELAALEAQVTRTHHQVPQALEADFANLEEVLEEINDDEEFDDEAFLEAVDPIRNWLEANCAS